MRTGRRKRCTGYAVSIIAARGRGSVRWHWLAAQRWIRSFVRSASQAVRPLDSLIPLEEEEKPSNIPGGIFLSYIIYMLILAELGAVGEREEQQTTDFPQPTGEK